MTVMQHDISLRDIEAIVIGASAGAIASLTQLLPPLAPDYPLPILVTVHVPPDHPNSIPALLQSKCRVTIKEAEDKEPLHPGTVYFAPPDYHLLVEKDRSLSLSNEEPVSFARPSIDVLFESAADVYGKALLALVLSGANHDGAKGSRSVVHAGGTVVVQTPDSSAARLMPESTLSACPEATAMSLTEMNRLLACRVPGES
jgi:two-component system chemotaxis response regulator CheB